MRKFLLSLAVVASGVVATPALAAVNVSYNTTGSTLSCASVAGCVQNNSTSVTVGGLTLTYNAGSGSNVATPSIINLGNIVSTGTGTNVDLTGLLLGININSTPPGGSGMLPNGTLSGSLSTNSSGTIITFAPNNTTTSFGTLPGVVIGDFTYQVLNPSLGLQAPTVGNPVGQTSIQGDVVSSVPEPATWGLMLLGFAGIGMSLRRRRPTLAQLA